MKLLISAGPLWFKNADAAAYAYVAHNNMILDGHLPNAVRLPLSGGCVAIISYDTANETATIAFSVSFCPPVNGHCKWLESDISGRPSQTELVSLLAH